MTTPETSLPVIAVAGYLGAGKTTAVEALVQGLPPGRAGWVIQDVSGFHGSGLTWNAAWRRIATRLPEANGCLGCALRADLVTEITAAVRGPDLDALVVEVPGVCDALHVTRCVDDDAWLADRIDVRVLVTVVDAPTFLVDLCSSGDRLPTCIHDLSLAELRIAQVEQAHAIVLTRTDDVDAGDTARVADLLGLLRPDAPILRPAELRAAVGDLLSAGTAPASAARPPPAGGSHSSAGMDVTRVRFSAARPFHPARLADMLTNPLPGVLRGRGRICLGCQPEVALAWDQTARTLALGAVGTWPAQGTIDLELIGIELDPAGLRATLDRCLVTDAELAAGPAAVAAAPHPFPTWDVTALDVLPAPTEQGDGA